MVTISIIYVGLLTVKLSATFQSCLKMSHVYGGHTSVSHVRAGIKLVSDGLHSENCYCLQTTYKTVEIQLKASFISARPWQNIIY